MLPGERCYGKPDKGKGGWGHDGRENVQKGKMVTVLNK